LLAKKYVFWANTLAYFISPSATKKKTLPDVFSPENEQQGHAAAGPSTKRR